MVSNVSNFYGFFRQLFIDVIRNPSRAISEIDAFPLASCLQFGWLCLLIATVASAGFQSVLIAQVLGALSSDPSAYEEMKQILGAANAVPMDEFVKSIEIARLSSLGHLLLSPLTAWFFLYLLSGALFALAKLFCVGKTIQNDYEQVIKIVSVGQAPLLFCLIPLIGPIVGNLWSIWFVARSIANLFQLNRLAGLSIAACSFFLLFSVWNSTVSLLATAYHNKNATTAAVISQLPPHEVAPQLE